MKLTRLLPLSAAVALLTGCSSGDAFVDRRYANNTFEVAKVKATDDNGQLRVCYGSDTPREERERLAEEVCAQWGLHAVLRIEQSWQCRLRVPHLAIYACIDPAMRLEDGTYVDPFNVDAVNQWRSRHPRPPVEGNAPAP